MKLPKHQIRDMTFYMYGHRKSGVHVIVIAAIGMGLYIFASMSIEQFFKYFLEI